MTLRGDLRYAPYQKRLPFAAWSRWRTWRRNALIQVIAGAALLLVGASVARSNQEPQIGTTPLGIGSRDRLAICIQPAEGAMIDKAEAVSAVQAAFSDLEKIPTWGVYAPYAVGGPQIDLG